MMFPESGFAFPCSNPFILRIMTQIPKTVKVMGSGLKRMLKMSEEGG
jgi:hypothetical protein